MGLDLLACWTTQPIVSFDLESTGIDTRTCGVVSVAALRFEGGREVAKFYSLIDPQMPIPAESSKIHGVVDADVAGKPRLGDVAADLLMVARDATPMGFNGIGYDKKVLGRFISGADCPLFDPEQRWIDPCVISRDVHKFSKGGHSLVKVCERYGVDIGNAHNAEADARATAHVLFRMLEKRDVGPMPLEQFLGVIAANQKRQDRDLTMFHFNKWMETASTEELRDALQLLQERKSA